MTTNLERNFVAVICCYNKAINKLSYIATDMESFDGTYPQNCLDDIQYILSEFRSNNKTEVLAHGEPVDVVGIVDKSGIIWEDSVDYYDPRCHTEEDMNE